MVTENSILRAKNALGIGQKDDYILKPDLHAEEFRPVAPGLSLVLGRSEIAITVDEYLAKDSEALAAQKEFRRIFNRANRLVLTTAVLSAMVLATGVLSAHIADGLEKVLLAVCSAGSVITGALAAKDLYTIRQGKLLEEWMTKRAVSESKRLEYFDAIAKADVLPADDELPIDLLKLEYFRRFQLDVQLAFFTRRAIEHRREAKKNLSYSGIAIAGGAAATGLAGVLTVLNANFAAIASLGAVFTAFSSYTTLREQIYQSQRIAERYAVTADTIRDIYRRLDDVRKAILQAGREPLLGFVNAVHEVLLSEHRQWLGEQEQRITAVGKLDTLLQQAKNTANEKKEPGLTMGKEEVTATED